MAEISRSRSGLGLQPVRRAAQMANGMKAEGFKGLLGVDRQFSMVRIGEGFNIKIGSLMCKYLGSRKGGALCLCLDSHSEIRFFA